VNLFGVGVNWALQSDAEHLFLRWLRPKEVAGCWS
jgi:hypothetical protein